MIIDFHTHIFKSVDAFPQVWIDELYAAKRAIMGDEAAGGWMKALDRMGTVEALIADMDEAGVDKAVCLPADVAIMSRQEAKFSVWENNEYVAEAQSRYPDRIIGFAGVDPMRGTEAIKLLEKGVKEWGLKGVKTFPSNWSVTDAAVQTFLSKVNDLGIPVLFHMGSDPLPFLIQYGNPAGLDNLSLWYPRMKMIAAHVARGYDELLTAMIWYKKGVIYTDLAGLQYEVMKSPWHFTLQMRYLMDKVPYAVLMGADWPWIKTPPMTTYKGWFDTVRNLKIPAPLVKMGWGMKDFSQEEKDMILGENARALLGI